MYLNILDDRFNRIAIIDDFTSLIWTKRYFECGDFEVYLKADNEMLSVFNRGEYVSRDDDDMICVIEKINLDTDIENGNYLTVSGRCLKSLLDRRIVWYQTNLYGYANSVLAKLIERNAINADDTNRNFSNLSIGSIPHTTTTINKQITGDSLYSTVIEFCKPLGWGFEIVPSENRRRIILNVFEGKDRSILQDENPRIIFSAAYDNLPRTNYSYSRENYRNTARIAGEGEGIQRKTAVVGEENRELDRYEMFVDARDLSSNDGEITKSKYHELLLQRGRDKLLESPIDVNVDGEIDATAQYKYKQDYYVGDIVSVITEYGVSAIARIIEIIECEDESGYKVIPTFSSWEV